MSDDIYTWTVHYQDGRMAREYDDTRPDGRGWSERESKPLHSISLFSVASPEKETCVVLPQNKEQVEPVFFRRRFLAVGTEERATVHCIGWKRGKEGVYLFVFPDGSILLTDDFQAV